MNIELCILIPHFNNSIGLQRTLQSINETINIHILIIDDGSDNPPIKESLQKLVSRNINIDLVQLSKNGGITNALNTGLNHIKQYQYKFIGRVDAGDLCIKDRFKEQTNYLNNNPKCAIVGCWANFFDSQTKNFLFTLKYPVTNQEIQKSKYLYNPFIHPGVTIRLDAMIKFGGYPLNYPALEDYALFFLILNNHDGHNIPKILLHYEVSPSSISTIKRFDQSLSKIKLLVDNSNYSFISFLGIFKSIILLLIPRGPLTFIKRFVFK